MNDRCFIKGYSELLVYVSRHNYIDFDDEYCAADGFENVRLLWKDGSLQTSYIDKLIRIGIAKAPSQQAWEMMYFYARNYYEIYGNMNMPRTYRTVDGIMLGAWIDRQKHIWQTLSEFQQKKLKNIRVNISDLSIETRNDTDNL